MAQNLVFAQMADLGVVWQKNNYTNKESSFNNITQQSNGTYLASGWIMDGGRQKGYVVNFNEIGEKLNEWILTPPNQTEWTAGNTGMSFVFKAFITPSGDIITFGTISNINAPDALKGYPVTTTVQETVFLKLGLWVAKMSSTGAVIANRLDRGNSILSEVIEEDTGNYVAVGLDSYNQQSNIANRIPCGLVRRYNSNLDIVLDNWNNGLNLSLGLNRWYSQLFVNGQNLILIDNVGSMYHINTAFTPIAGVVITPLANGEGCIPPFTAPLTSIATVTISRKNGGYFFTGRLAAGLGMAHHAVGSAFYSKDQNNNLIKCEVTQPVTEPLTKLYKNPYLLPGSQNKYVGTLSANNINYMYLVEDNTTSFTLTPTVENIASQGIKMPCNTPINIVSQVDGFFSCGQDDATKLATIAKMSSCINFKTNALPSLPDVKK